jgi:AraC family transcriptional regulator of adaptative response/methylated-DNA-[protein]-cysteine methyltransferase
MSVSLSAQAERMSGLNFNECWEAIRRRDAAQDGRFFVGVLTTGVYRRPSCATRLPVRKNVRFYQSILDAERDGLRPCPRCFLLRIAGDDTLNDRVHKVCRYIETHASESLKLADLAKNAGLSRFHFQRSFKAVVGVTPKQYLEALRLNKLKEGLRQFGDVTEAVYNAGYGSLSRVYERVDTRLGMTPNQYRRHGCGVNISHVTITAFPLGLIMIGATDRGVCFVQFGGSTDELLTVLKREYPKANHEPMIEPLHPEFQRWLTALTNHLAGKQPHLDLPVDIRATAFQMRVRNYLQTVPYGDAQSNGEVAGIGEPKAPRAFADACARNTVALMIPCHRVIRGAILFGDPANHLPQYELLGFPRFFDLNFF